MTFDTILWVLALGCFMAEVIGVPARVSWIALGLAFCVLTQLV